MHYRGACEKQEKRGGGGAVAWRKQRPLLIACLLGAILN